MTELIIASDISKAYKVYDKPINRVKEALSLSRNKYHSIFYALKDINFTVNQGESLGFVGVNGSGKSTILQIIAGVLTPSSGSISVKGQVAAILELGSGFNPEFTGLENVKFHCSLMEVPEKKQKKIIKQIEEFAEIGDFIYRPVKTYSSGMYVRLAFSAAIMVDPDILIVDEALAVGDIRFQSKCLRKIREFRKKGKTLLFVSHDAGAVKSLCDRAILLSKGSILCDGSPDQVIKFYNNMLALEDYQDPHLEEKAESLAKRSGTGRAQIKKVFMVNANGQQTDTFVGGEKAKLIIEVEVFEDLVRPTVGFSFHDRLGNEIFGMNNYLLGVSFGDWKAGENRTVEYAIDLNLGTNIYNVSVSCHPEDTHLIENYDWVNDVLVFKIIPSFKQKFVGFTCLHTEASLKE